MRYWILDSPNGENRLNEVSEATGFTCVAIVDEDAGGAVAYAHHSVAQEIVDLLNERAIAFGWRP